MSAWSVSLNGEALVGGVEAPAASGLGHVRGYLTSPPEGLGKPALRTEDQAFPQRDGVAHYSDWYEPRIITLEEVSITPDVGCPQCPSARVRANALMSAWDRHCVDTELVIFTDCHGEEATTPDEVVAVNLIPNSSVKNNADDWELESTGTLTRGNSIATPANVGSGYYVENVDPTPGSSVRSPEGEVEPLFPYVGGIWVWSNSSGVGSAEIRFLQESGATAGVPIGGPPVSVPAATWTWLPVPSVTAPASAATARVVGAVSLATTARFTGAIVQEGTDPVTYFDGDTPDTLSNVYAWNGADGQSTSTKYGLADMRPIVGPFGVVGRPRVAELTWLGQGTKVAEALFRFDSVDHRLYVLDSEGTPGSGGECSTPIDAQAESVAYDIAVQSTPNLSRYWKLNDTGSTATATVGGSNGTLTGGTKSVTPLAVGTSRAYSSGTAVLPFPAYNAEVSVEFWINFQGSNATVFSAGGGTFELFQSILGTVFTWRGVDAGPGSPMPFFPTGVHHVVITDDGTDVIIYLDSFAWFQMASPGPGAVSAQNWQWGDAFSWTNIRSDVSVYTRALTEAEVSEHFEAGRVFTGTGGAKISGSLAVPIKVTFSGTLTRPRLITPDGSFVGLSQMPSGATEVVVDTALGIATYTNGAGVSVTDPSIVSGDPFLELGPGYAPLALSTNSTSDTGTATVCWRPAVLSA